MKTLKSIFAFVALMTGSFASAATLTLTFDSTTAVTNNSNVYVGPYFGHVAGAVNNSLILYCIDSLHHVDFGQTWTAQVSDLGSGTIFPVAGSGIDASRGVRYANAPATADGTALERYRKAAYLASLYSPGLAGPAVTPGYNGPNNFADVHATIWQLFDPTAAAPSSSYYHDLANANGASFNAAGWQVLTAVGPGLTAPNPDVQEFLIYAAPQAVPEPMSVALTGSGLIICGWMARRRRREQ